MKIKYNKSLAASLAAIIITASIASAVIRGDDSNNEIYGTTGEDEMYGLNGNDTLIGLAGNDALIGGNGDDKLNGLEGNDLIIGDSGNDDCYGSSGFDYVIGGTGNDYVSTGSGGGSCYGGEGDDLLFSSSFGLEQLELATLSGGSGSDVYELYEDSKVFVHEEFKTTGAGDGVNKAIDIMDMNNSINNIVVFLNFGNAEIIPDTFFFSKSFKGYVKTHFARTIEQLYFDGKKVSWYEIYQIWLTQPW